MQPYLQLLHEVLSTGTKKEDRTGVGILSLFGKQLRFNLQEGFPAVTTKKLYFHGVKGELLWFLQGLTNVKWLQDQNIHIWDAWADEHGDLGPIYGFQWRKWRAQNPDTGLNYQIDQIAKVIETIKSNPNSRRMLVTAWNPGELDWMALPPCHVLFQFYVADGKLSCQLYQRSADLFLGVPFNIASYALLTHMIAQVCGLDVGEFIHTFGDVHIYLNHIEQVKEQLSREPFPLPRLWLNPDIKNIDDFTMDDIQLLDYKSHPPIKAEVAV